MKLLVDCPTPRLAGHGAKSPGITIISFTAGLGMNEAELARNAVLTDFTVKDLNTDPKMPYEDASFDVVTNAVSVDYLTKPLEVFREIRRVLKPGGWPS